MYELQFLLVHHSSLKRYRSNPHRKTGASIRDNQTIKKDFFYSNSVEQTHSEHESANIGLMFHQVWLDLWFATAKSELKLRT